MVEVREIQPQGETWAVDLKVFDGVYRLDRYPVRVEDVPLPPEGLSEDRQRELMGRFVVKRVTHHMRRGSLPPRGTRLDGGQVWQEMSGEA